MATSPGRDHRAYDVAWSSTSPWAPMVRSSGRIATAPTVAITIPSPAAVHRPSRPTRSASASRPPPRWRATAGVVL